MLHYIPEKVVHDYKTGISILNEEWTSYKGSFENMSCEKSNFQAFALQESRALTKFYRRSICVTPPPTIYHLL